MYQKKNLAYGNLSSQLVASGLAFSLQSGEGARFPATGSGSLFVGVFWGSGYSSPHLDANAEFIVAYREHDDYFRVPVSGFRGREGTSAQAWEISDNFMLTESAASLAEYAGKDNVLELNRETPYTPTAEYHPATKKYVDSGTIDMTNKRIVPRVNTVASDATPDINVDTTDLFTITALATAITSMSSGLSGTPTNGQRLIIRILDDGTARAIAWGASFASRGATLPTTTVSGKYLYVGLIYNSTASVWDCVAVSQES